MRLWRHAITRVAVCALAFGLAAHAAEAASARVLLKDGTWLRGDVVEADDGVWLSNAAGRTRLARDEIEKIEYLDAAPPPPTTKPAQPKEPPQTQPQNEPNKCWVQNGDAPTTQEAEPEAPEKEATTRPRGMEIPPLLDARDINRLRLYELTFVRGGLGEHDPLPMPEDVQVRFVNPRGEPDLEQLVRADIAKMPAPPPGWEQVLEHGKPLARLGLILRTTGMRYADRIEIRSDPEVFATFRKRVLPLVTKDCARSGCHSGPGAQALRFPTAPATGEAFAYTAFLILSTQRTRVGPLINRTLPDESALLTFMLPAEALPTNLSDHVHPPLKRGRFTPPLQSARDAEYAAIRQWIATLRNPAPEYQLEYRFPGWLRATTQPAR